LLYIWLNDSSCFGAVQERNGLGMRIFEGKRFSCGTVNFGIKTAKNQPLG
jgi:hypothetical protein